MNAVGENAPQRPSEAEAVAGYLAALAIFVALIGLAWHPLRLIGPAIVVSLVAAAMGGTGRHRRLALAGVLIVAACFFFGLLIAVVTSRPLW